MEIGYKCCYKRKCQHQDVDLTLTIRHVFLNWEITDHQWVCPPSTVQVQVQGRGSMHRWLNSTSAFSYFLIIQTVRSGILYLHDEMTSALYVTYEEINFVAFNEFKKEITQAPDWSTSLELLIHSCCDKVGQRLGEENLIGAKNKACLEYVTRTRCIQKTEQAHFCREGDQTNSEVREKLKMHTSQRSVETLKHWNLDYWITAVSSWSTTFVCFSMHEQYERKSI